MKMQEHYEDWLKKYERIIRKDEKDNRTIDEMVAEQQEELKKLQPNGFEK